MQKHIKIIVRLLDSSSYSFETLNTEAQMNERLNNDKDFIKISGVHKNFTYFKKSEIKEIWYG